MALRGDLASVDLAQVFQMLALNKKSGLLSIQSPRLWEVLYFQPRGVTLYYNRHALLDRAIQSFVRVGRVEQQAIDEARAHAARHGHEFWDALLAGGYLSEEELVAQMRYEVEEEIYELFFCRDGRFEFLEGQDQLPEREGVVDQRFFFNTESVIMEAARRIDEWSFIQDRIPSAREVFRRIGKEEAPPECGEDGAIVLDQVDGWRSVSRIVEASGLSNFIVWKCLSQLFDAGLIEPLDSDELVRTGQACMGKGRPQDAVNLYEKAMELEIGVPEVHALAAAAYEQLGEYESAARHQKCEAEFRIASGDLRLGAQRLRAAAALLPTDLATRERLALLVLEHPEVRLPDYDAIGEGRALVDLWMAVGDQRRVQGLLERLLAARPDDVELMKQLVSVHTKAGETERVIALYEQIAAVLVAGERPIEAIACLQKVLMLDRSRRDVAEQVRALYARDERARRRRRALATLGAFCLLIVALGVAYSVYDEAARSEFERIDVTGLIASREYDHAALAYEEFLIQYPLTTVSRQAKAELLAIGELRRQRIAELDDERRSRDEQRLRSRNEYKDEWQRHLKLFQQGDADGALVALESARKHIAAAGTQDDIAWSLVQQVEKTYGMLREFVESSRTLEQQRTELLAQGDLEGAWQSAVTLLRDYEITAAARRSLIPVEIHSRPEGARILRDGRPILAMVAGKERELRTPAVVEFGRQPQELLLEKEGFSPQPLVVRSMDRARVEAPLPVIPAHRMQLPSPALTEVAADGDWAAVGLKNGKVAVLSARSGKTTRLVDLGGLRAIDGAPAVFGDRAFFATNENTLECLLLDSGRSPAGWPAALPAPAATRLVLRDGRILLVDRDNALHCFDQSSGRRYWSLSLDGVPSGPPALERRVVHVALASGAIVLVDASSGRALRTLRTGVGLSTRAWSDGETDWVGCADGKVRAFDLATSRVAWTADLGRACADEELCLLPKALAVAAGNRLLLIARADGKAAGEARAPAPIVSVRRHGNALLTVARQGGGDGEKPFDLLQARDEGSLTMLWEYQDKGQLAGWPGVGGACVGVSGSDGDVVLLR